MISIKRAENGWAVTQAATGEAPESLAVFSDDRCTEVEAFTDLLRYLLDQLGPSTSRYSEQRIYIEIRPGDKRDPVLLRDST